MRSVLTADMPQITASTARRSMLRLASSSAEKFCACAGVCQVTNASADKTRSVFFMEFSLFPRMVRNRTAGVDWTVVQPVPLFQLARPSKRVDVVHDRDLSQGHLADDVARLDVLCVNRRIADGAGRQA